MFLIIESLYEPLYIVCWDGDVGGVFSQENTPECQTETRKRLFFHITSKWEKWRS